MSAFHVPSIRDQDFGVETSHGADEVRLTFTGNADGKAIQPLEDLLEKLHPEVVRVGAKKVIVDFLNLEFMNSSCFKSFVAWISKVQEETEQYRVTFLSNPETLWQRRSLHALSCFAADLISIETCAPAS
jgi:hypothetical protein